MLVWLMEKDELGGLRPVNEPLRLVAEGTREQRNIHVDGKNFALGFPLEMAFALEDTPPGKAAISVGGLNIWQRLWTR